MKRWFRYWAEYPFAHKLVKEENFLYQQDASDLLIKDHVREWAESTADGRAICRLEGRYIRCGFERTDPPPHIKQQQIDECRKKIEYQVQRLRELINDC